MITRRQGAAIAMAVLAGPPAARAASGKPGTLAEDLAQIESASGGRLGLAALDTGSGARILHRADERFPLCSTFKLLAAGAVLARADAGQESLDRRIRFRPEDLVTYSPATGPRAGGEGMTLAELCEAAMTLSDNTAGNLLLSAIGGPAGLTGFARRLGDPVTRLDRVETALNEALPGDPRDTTTPEAMVADLQALALGDALSPGGRAQLIAWLVGTRTGDTRIKAGLPAGWRFGDKTGSGERGTANDVGLFWPPGRPPVLFAAYLTETEAPMERRNATHAAIGRALAAALG
ncbi:class A beta-lactamase [Paracraurococcus lichenis]|uniref:Beta-lactamase n=1 Tax=Paracraurococcus lichenis TaxID=3064888 RepID=A0ABT9E1Y9_9PROT|nr:class A beta-lactamase [Paracraurococcus sp. LOR1-02]MDO9710183.1 class A beta-lactamase [Paracraurococcus sp. LOR1-02]